MVLTTQEETRLRALLAVHKARFDYDIARETDDAARSSQRTTLVSSETAWKNSNK